MTHIEFPQDLWSETENWIWQEICSGRIADLNKREGRNEPLDTTNSKGWNEKRKVRSNFLKQILLRQAHCSAIPHEGVRIIGALFTEEINLDHGRLAYQLWLEHCRFEKAISLKGLQIDSWFSLEGSTVVDQNEKVISLDLNGAKITGIVGLGGCTFMNVNLIASSFGSQLSMNKATIFGDLIMNGIRITQSLLAKEANLNNVNFIGSTIGGQFNLNGTTISGDILINVIEVEQALLMGMGANFNNMKLIGSKVRGDLILNNARITGNLDIESSSFHENVYITASIFEKTTHLIFAHIARNLNLSGSKFANLDLSGTRIEGELSLGSDEKSRTQWNENAQLNLRNVFANTLQDRRDLDEKQNKSNAWWKKLHCKQEIWEESWPPKLQLDGFIYHRLGGFNENPEPIKCSHDNCDIDMQNRNIQWHINWLDRDLTYSPQPYEQLASVFRSSGNLIKANRILYENRKRARTEAWRKGEYSRWLGSSLLNWTIGYGLGARYFRALLWVIALTVTGAFILHFSGQPANGLDSGLAAKAVYSLDQILPIVEFEKYNNVKLTGGVAYYFYMQKLFGWVLGSFLIAGLAGLTQKR